MQLPAAETAFNWKIVQSSSFCPFSLCCHLYLPRFSREPVWKPTSPPSSIDINSSRIELYFCLLGNIEPKTIAADKPLTSRPAANRNHLFNQTLCFMNSDKPHGPISRPGPILSVKQTWNKRIRNSLWNIGSYLRLIY